jgi:chemotaxis protein MotB
MWDKDQKHPIIVKKVVKAHAAHHGGSWKVAYADFVTAMMALFIVLWLMNADEATKKAVSVYFRDPRGAENGMGTGAHGLGDGLTIQRDDMNRLKEKIQSVMKKLPDFTAALDKHVQITVTGEGLRIELLETDTGMFFESGNATPTTNARSLLSAVASELGQLPNRITIEGHTDARPFTSRAAYTNWELSADRANAARRLMQTTGLRLDQVTQVRGFADQRLKMPQSPEDPSNRRISIVVQNQQNPAEPENAAGH